MDRKENFLRLWGANWLAGRYLLPELRAIGAAQSNTVILDLACGESPFRDCFPTASRYIRVDRYATDAEVIAGDMLAIPLPDASVDCVLLFQAITDVPRPWDVLIEIKRVLRPGGSLLIYESVSYPEHDAPYDYYRLMPEGLRYWAKTEGFSITRIRYLGGLATRLASIWSKIFLGRLVHYRATRPLGYVLTALGNVIFYSMAHFESDGPRASDYLAILERPKLDFVPHPTILPPKSD